MAARGQSHDSHRLRGLWPRCNFITMATLDATIAAIAPIVVSLSANQTGTGDTTNILDRGSHMKANAVRLRFYQAIGATPTCTYQIQVATDSSLSWANATYADISTPNTDVSTSFALTGGGLAGDKLVKGTNWRYLKVVLSANTNVNLWLDAWIDDYKRWV